MSHGGLFVQKVDDVGEQCELWRLQVPLRDVEELRTVSSKYSPDFNVAGVPWLDQDDGRVQPVFTHLMISGRLGRLPYMRMPIRKMRAAAQTTPKIATISSTTDRAISHQGGICDVIRMIMIMGEKNAVREVMHYDNV